MFTRCDRSRQKTSSRAAPAIVECPVVRRARILTGHDGDGIIHQRRMVPPPARGSRSPTLIARRSRRPWRSLTSCRSSPAGRSPTTLPDRPSPVAVRQSGACQLHSCIEPRRVHRLQKIVYGVDLERLDGALIVSVTDDLRQPLVVEHAACHFEPVSPGICVEKDRSGWRRSIVAPHQDRCQPDR